MVITRRRAIETSRISWLLCHLRMSNDPLSFRILQGGGASSLLMGEEKGAASCVSHPAAPLVCPPRFAPRRSWFVGA
jgi:hypothetical protein